MGLPKCRKLFELASWRCRVTLPGRTEARPYHVVYQPITHIEMPPAVGSRLAATGYVAVGCLCNLIVSKIR